MHLHFWTRTVAIVVKPHGSVAVQMQACKHCGEPKPNQVIRGGGRPAGVRA